MITMSIEDALRVIDSLIKCTECDHVDPDTGDRCWETPTRAVKNKRLRTGEDLCDKHGPRHPQHDDVVTEYEPALALSVIRAAVAKVST